MQFSESWLRTLVDPPLTTQELAHLLTMSGLEVEACEPVAPPFSGVVVGRVRAVEQASECRPADGVPGRCRRRALAAHRLRRAERRRRHEGAGRTGRREAAGETADQPFEIKAATMRGVRARACCARRASSDCRRITAGCLRSMRKRR